MPSLADIAPITYADPLKAFIANATQLGSRVESLQPGETIDSAIRRLYPEAKTIASALPEVTVATANPDTVAAPSDLDRTDLSVIRGKFGVAENGCIWIEQEMKERVSMFIAEELIIILPKEEIVSNMHQAAPRITFNSYGYGVFISGPSKTADIAQVLVMGAQAARGVTILLE